MEALLDFDKELIEKFNSIFDIIKEFTPELHPATFKGKRARKKGKSDKNKVNLNEMENKFSLLNVEDEDDSAEDENDDLRNDIEL